MAKTTQQPQEAIRILNLVEHNSVCLIPASGQMMVRPKVVHIALLNWTSDLFPSLSRAQGRKRFQLFTKTGTLSRKSRELESVRTERGKNTPKSLVLKCVIAAVWETA